MSRYEPLGVVSTVSQINAELERVAESMKDLYSRIGDGPNQMTSDLDMNSNRVLNLPKPKLPTEPVRLQDVGNIGGGTPAPVSSNLGYYNVKDFGATGDGVTDDTSFINAAIAELKADGGGVLFFPTGTYRTVGNHEIVSNMTVMGTGYTSCIKTLSGQEPVPLFIYITEDRPNLDRENVEFRDIRMEGLFDENYIEEGQNGVITAVGIDEVLITGCYFQWISNFGLNMNQCANVRVINNTFKYVARDACAVWGTPNVIVANNSFIGTDDDCISINTAAFEPTNDVLRDGIIITGNYLRDTGSINVQMAKNCVISNNVMRLCKGGSAIILEGVSFGEVNDGNLHTCVVESNLIVDSIDRLLSTRPNPAAISSNLRLGIVVTQKPYTTEEIESGYDYNYSTSGDSNQNPVTQNHSILVRNNIVTRTVDGDGVTYESLGYGKMFSRFQNSSTAANAGTPPAYFENGFVNPVLSDANFQVRPMEIRDSLSHSQITGNIFQGSGDRGILFNQVDMPAESNRFVSLIIKDNVIRNFRNSGVDLDQYENTAQSVLIENNIFDGDPYHQDTNRNSDGSWDSKVGCVAIEAKDQKGLRIIENTFKNCSIPWSTGGGDGNNYEFRRNKFIGQPHPSGSGSSFSEQNKGMGLFPYFIDPEMDLVWIDADPTSPTYQESLGKQVQQTSNVPPSEGYYFLGQIVWARGGYPVLGFRRLTTGSGNVAGVDWQELRGAPVSGGGSPWSPTGNVIDASSESTAIVGGAYLQGTIYLLSNAASNERVFRYTNFAHDGADFAISGAGLFVRDLNYNYSDNNRWVTGSGATAYEYNSSWVATGRSIGGAGAGVAQVGSFLYAISSAGLVTVYNSGSANPTGTTFNTGISNVVGIAQGAGPSPDLYIVDSSGVVHTSTTDGTTVATLFNSGLAATGISVDRAGTGNVLITTSTGATEFAEN